MTTPYWTRPEPPYQIAIFTIPSGKDPEGYAEMSSRMVALAETQPGYLGREPAVLPDGGDLVVIHYADAGSIRAWKRNPRASVGTASRPGEVARALSGRGGSCRAPTKSPQAPVRTRRHEPR